METLFKTHTPPLDIKKFDAWLSAWGPLIDAIRQRRTRLLVTLEQFCDAAKLNEDEARGLIWMSRDRFPCITIDIYTSRLHRCVSRQARALRWR